MANKYWVGNGTNWSSTASWSLTSGGAAGAAIANTTDVPIFDINSGNAINNANGSNQTNFFGNVIFATYSGIITMNSEIWTAQTTINGGNPVNVAGTYSLVPRAGGNAIITGDTNAGWRGVISPFSGTDFNISGTFSLGEIFLRGSTSLNSSTYSLALTTGFYRTTTAILDGTATITFIGGTWSGSIRNSIELAGNVEIVNGGWVPSSGQQRTFRYISGNINHTGTFSVAYATTATGSTLDTYGMTFSSLIFGSSIVPGNITLASTVSANTMGFLGYGSVFANGLVALNGVGSFVSDKLHLSLPGAVSQWPNIISIPEIRTNNMVVLTTYNGLATGANTNLISGTISVGNLTIPSNKNFVSTNQSSGQGTTNLYLSNGTWSGNGPLQTTNTFIVGDYSINGPVTWTPISGTFAYTSGNVTTNGTFSTLLRGLGAITLDTNGMTFSTISMPSVSANTFVTFNSTVSTIDCYIPPQALTSNTTFQGDGSLYADGTLYADTAVNSWTKNWFINNSKMWRVNGLSHLYGTLILNGTPSISVGTLNLNSTVNSNVRLLLSGGTWSANSAFGRLYSSVYFTGDYAIRGDVYWQYVTTTSGQAAHTMSYVSGNIATEGSRLNIGELRSNNFCNMDTGSMSFDQVRFYYVSGGIVKLISDLNTTGTCSLISSSPLSLTNFGNAVGGNGTFRTKSFVVPTNSGLAPVGTDWYVGKLIGTSSTIRIQTTTYSIVCNDGMELQQTAWLGAFTGTNIAYNSLVITGGTVSQIGTSSYLYCQGNMIIRPDTSNIDINAFIQIPNGTYRLTYYRGTYSVNVSGGTLDISSGSGGACIIDTHPIVWNDIQVLPNVNGQATRLTSTLSAYGTVTIDNFSNGVLPFSFSTAASLDASSGTIWIKTNQTRTYALPKSYSNIFKWQNTSTSAGTTTLTLSGNGLDTGSLIHGTHTATFSSITGGMPIRFVGNGTWSGNNLITNNIIFDTAANVLKLDSALKYSTGTITYTSGFVDSVSNNNTLFITGSSTFNTNGMNWHNVQISTTNSSINIASTMSIAKNLNVINPLSFTGTSGFHTRNLAIIGGVVTYSFRRNSIYTVTNSLTLQGFGTASRLSIVSDSVGTYSYFTLLHGATQSVNYVSARDINSSLGRTIRNYRGVQNNTVNWLLLPATFTKFKIDGL